MQKQFKTFLSIITIMIFTISPMLLHAVPNETVNLNEENSEDSSQLEIVEYPLVAYFEGIENGVNIDGNSFVIPNDFSGGNVVVKAKVCVGDNNSILPDNGDITCDDKREITLRIEGMIINEQIERTVDFSSDGIEIHEGFDDCGKVSVHYVNYFSDNITVNRIVNIVSENLIDIKLDAPIPLSHSFGSTLINHTIVTNNNIGDASIFFGNSETTIIASGPNVDKITGAVGGDNVSINPDGSVTVELPELFRETTTSVVITILMKDGTTVDRQININRTSVLLQYHNGAGDNSVYAGYVFNKAYLYNNQNHNDDIFDAYLQVTLYKDDVVVGFKQIKIDDEDHINNLLENESGSIELYSDNQIPLYGKVTDDLIDGVNKVSVFLTNGPIDFDKELPSIEFGIGSGVTLEWEEN